MGRGGAEARSDALTRQIIAAAIEVHRHLGAGLLESTYERCLAWELVQSGVSVRCQVPLPVRYKTLRVAGVYRLDMVVEDQAIVEVKAVERLHPVHRAQLVTYLHMTGLTRGLLLNFQVAAMRDGIHRIVLGYERPVNPG